MTFWKRLFFFCLLLAASCSCASGPAINNPDDEDEGWDQWDPYFFTHFRYIISLHATGSRDISQKEVMIICTPYNSNGKEVVVPEEKYDSLRIMLGDTIRFYHGDAIPFGQGMIHDYSDITIVSNTEYHGINAGESLNSIVDYTYYSVIPWLKSGHIDNYGLRNDWDAIESAITRRLNELDPFELNGASPRCKLTFPVAPLANQKFTLTFSGPTRTISVTFSVPCEETLWNNYY